MGRKRCTFNFLSMLRKWYVFPCRWHKPFVFSLFFQFSTSTGENRFITIRNRLTCKILLRKRQLVCFCLEFGPILTLCQTTNFRLFQTDRVCRRQSQFRSKWRKVLQIGRKHCVKRINCSLRVIYPLSTVFSKDFYRRHVKNRACLGKGSMYSAAWVTYMRHDA